MPSARRRNASVAANPVLIGAVTTLVVAVAVFLAYNANNGLPFVPTYAVDVMVDDAAELVLNWGDARIGNMMFGDDMSVTGVLDWEFAHAGCTVTDLGNLIRFDRQASYMEAMLDAYRVRMPDVEGGPDLVNRARSADLWALIDLAARRHSSPVAARADEHLRAIARARDVNALPPR